VKATGRSPHQAKSGSLAPESSQAEERDRSAEAGERFSRPFAPNVRFDRVEEIRKALASGKYKVSSAQVANSLIAHLRRS
jgi:anti-sigma28 factor (negative regulator of flagellin synthesis)